MTNLLAFSTILLGLAAAQPEATQWTQKVTTTNSAAATGTAQRAFAGGAMEKNSKGTGTNDNDTTNDGIGTHIRRNDDCSTPVHVREEKHSIAENTKKYDKDKKRHSTNDNHRASVSGTRRPNIILLLTDDQDVLLGGMDYMPNLKKYMQGEGVTFERGYVHTPICCPSRSSILTGSYLHNGVAQNNGVAGNCYGDSWKAEVEPKRSFAVHAHAAGYRTSYAGKYLNAYGSQYRDGKANPKEAVPPGWDKWFGLVGNSVYYDYDIIQSDDSGQSYVVKHHDDDYAEDYLPDIVTRRSLDVLEEWLSADDNQQDNSDQERSPFLLVNAWPTPHQPFTPAPWANDTRLDLTAPVTPNYNASDDSMQKKHWILRQLGPMNESHVEMIDDMYHHRIESLLSVDEHIRQIIDLLDSKGELDNTYILYTSDNGFQLGQHRLLYDKRHLYENDIRVPYILRGPGIPKNATAQEECVALNVDIAPTFFDIVHNLTHPNAPSQVDEAMTQKLAQIQTEMDGQSILPCFYDNTYKKPNKITQQNDLEENYAVKLRRTDFLVTYFGEYQQPCELWWCDWTHLHAGFPFPIDGKNNTYNCVRTIVSGSQNTTKGVIKNGHSYDKSKTLNEDTMYCRFEDKEDRFGEFYDLNVDPWQLHNTYSELTSYQKDRYEARLEELKACKGSTCHEIISPGRQNHQTKSGGASSRNAHVDASMKGSKMQMDKELFIPLMQS